MDFRGKRITVMGLGRFGGGVGATRFLATRGARVTVTDQRSEDELSDSLAALDGSPVAAFHLGGHDAADFREADIVVASPAVPRDNRYLQIARAAGAVVTSEMNLFWQHNRGRVVAVTGSNGKSTTTALIHALLTAGGLTCHLGGNIGRSLLPDVDEIAADDIVVLELSSFQLEDLAPLRPQAEVAVVTNFTANHLDRHGTIDAYRAAKQQIVQWQRPEQLAILNGEDADVRNWPGAARRLFFSAASGAPAGIYRCGANAVFCAGGEELSFPLGDWLTLPGAHNFQNALAATACALSLGVPLTAIESGLRGFEALPHRLQLVAEIGGCRYYDDSIATTPESVAAALDAFAGPVVLLAGGYDKGVDLTEFARLIGRRCKAVALLGQTGAALHRELRQGSAAYRLCGDLAEAVDWAMSQTVAGDVVLLSPGCASYDWFRDFRERGTVFAELVRIRSARRAG